MLRIIILPALTALALAVGGAAFAATDPAPIIAAQVAVRVSVSRDKVNEISKQCFARQKNDKAAYKTCFQDKVKTAETEITAK